MGGMEGLGGMGGMGGMDEDDDDEDEDDDEMPALEGDDDASKKAADAPKAADK
jgi:hypothetical protein